MTIVEDVRKYILYDLYNFDHKASYSLRIAKIDLSQHTNEKTKSNPNPFINWRSKFNP